MKALEGHLARWAEINRTIDSLSQEISKLKGDQQTLVSQIGIIDQDKITRRMGELQVKLEMIPQRIKQLESERHALQFAILGEMANQKRSFLDMVATRRQQAIAKLEKVLMPFYGDEREVKNVVARLDPPAIKTISRAWNRIQSGLTVAPLPTPEIVEVAQQFLNLLQAISAELELA